MFDLKLTNATLPDGRTIKVTVLESDRGHTRLGFEAPVDVRIHREELLKETGS